MKTEPDKKQMQDAEDIVTQRRITLLDEKDGEYEFLILDELAYQGKNYLALVSCDEKTDTGAGADPGEANDIVVVQVEEDGGEKTLTAVSDADILYGLSKILDEKYGHLG
ncbi:DUF1292 domain-containing protein [Ruminococcus sp. CLA-AA-H200]|uniref:DUF1292 domain-containing protein n=1 Tax=Ruminococcus turbiniformis TaxID=2881258 RepID=A0ABS8G1V0_9FIRM|nr:DUF1292 domain-containing protein [Ruminococcus turbiniformis]MCC2255397.1 DUF1292 domain-containing protein [Ruminococcus turbiniformis]